MVTNPPPVDMPTVAIVTGVGPSPTEGMDMGKGKGRRGWRPGHRDTPARLVGHPSLPRDDEPDLLAQVRELLTGDHPMELLVFASAMLDALEPAGPLPLEREGDEDEFGLQDLVDSLVAVPLVETTALLTVLAELVADELLARRIRRELRKRDHRLPAWLTSLVPVAGMEALLASNVLGVFDLVLVGITTGGGADVTVIVETDHTLGTVATEGLWYPGPVEVARDLLGDDDPDVIVSSIELADARTRIEEAVEVGRITFPPFETDTWPRCRPLVEWVTRQLPSGGQGHVRPAFDEDDQAALVERFLGSRFGCDHDHDDGRSLLHSLLWYGCDYGTGDPLTWSTTEVELLLADWIPRKIIADAEYLSGAPDLLRDLIRFGHAQRGVRDELTTEALEAVDTFEPEYQRTIRSDRPQGPAALLDAMGWSDDDEGFGLPGPLETFFATSADELAEAVGGVTTLDTLETAPLPDESLDLQAVPAKAREAVGQVCALTDAWCDSMLDDVEYATACRRLLVDLAVADPGIFTGRGRVDTAAAAIAWIIGKVNGLFDAWSWGWTVAEMTDWFGVTNPSQRAKRMLAALGHDGDVREGIRLGTPRYLVSGRREAIAEQRDIGRAYLAGANPFASGGLLPFGDEDGDTWDDGMWDDGDEWDGDMWNGAAWDDDPWQPLLKAFGPADEQDDIGELGVDPAPNLPWLGPDPVDVLAVGWFPPEEFAIAMQRWPALAQRTGTDDYEAYARVVQASLIDLAREFNRHPGVVALEVAALVDFAEAWDVDPAASRTRAALAAALDRQDEARAWPPGRNEACWCGSGRKYKRCCDTVALDPGQRPVPTPAGAAGVHAYELEVSLVGVTPRIWRRLRIFADATFADLHVAIQLACGWDNTHLFAFRTLDGGDIAAAGFDDGMFGEPAPESSTVPLAAWFARADRCLYEYDFGDGWIHDIRVTERIQEPFDQRLQLVAGARAFPPEDCGGIPGYDACVEAVTTGEDPDYDLVEWIGGWDPEAFDLAQTARYVER